MWVRTESNFSFILLVENYAPQRSVENSTLRGVEFTTVEGSA